MPLVVGSIWLAQPDSNLRGPGVERTLDWPLGLVELRRAASFRKVVDRPLTLAEALKLADEIMRRAEEGRMRAAAQESLGVWRMWRVRDDQYPGRIVISHDSGADLPLPPWHPEYRPAAESLARAMNLADRLAAIDPERLRGLDVALG